MLHIAARLTEITHHTLLKTHPDCLQEEFLRMVNIQTLTGCLSLSTYTFTHILGILKYLTLPKHSKLFFRQFLLSVIEGTLLFFEDFHIFFTKLFLTVVDEINHFILCAPIASQYMLLWYLPHLTTFMFPDLDSNSNSATYQVCKPGQN